MTIYGKRLILKEKEIPIFIREDLPREIHEARFLQRQRNINDNSSKKEHAENLTSQQNK